ncbi:MAG: response regulator transcription factor [Tissierellia bacterium]|nr:response regulator transcription factor [Tissierellia bacterium]
MVRILIADDNKEITNIIKLFAQREGMQVDVANDGRQALDMYRKNDYSILLLDIMMPYIDGYELLRTIRKESMLPIILITAKGEDYERIMGLDYGADDYIVKPFSVAEVMARIRAILRRVEDKEGPKTISYGNLFLDLDKYESSLDNKPVKLTKKEFEILWTLASYKDKAFTRENLLDTIWGYDYYGDSRTVDTHIKRLRAKMAQAKGWTIETIRGVGYKFEVNNEEQDN